MKRQFINMSHKDVNILFDSEWLFSKAYDHPAFDWIEKQNPQDLKKIDTIFPGGKNEINILWRLSLNPQETNLKNLEDLEIKNFYPLTDEIKNFVPPLPPDATNQNVNIWSSNEREEIFTKSQNGKDYSLWHVDKKEKIWKRKAINSVVWRTPVKPKVIWKKR